MREQSVGTRDPTLMARAREKDGVAVSSVFEEILSDCPPASSRSTNQEKWEAKATIVTAFRQ